MLFSICRATDPFPPDAGQVRLRMTVLATIKEMRLQLTDGLLQFALVRFSKTQTRIGLHPAQQLDVR